MTNMIDRQALAANSPNVEAVSKLVREAQRLCEWTLVAPDGRVWITDKPEKLIAVIAPHLWPQRTESP